MIPVMKVQKYLTVNIQSKDPLKVRNVQQMHRITIGYRLVMSHLVLFCNLSHVCVSNKLAYVMVQIQTH